MICAFNARGFLTDPAMRSAFGLNDRADDKTIQKQLILKKISYGSLNGALVSDQDKDKFETCFVFNSEQMDSFASGKTTIALKYHPDAGTMDALKKANPDVYRDLVHDLQRK